MFLTAVAVSGFLVEWIANVMALIAVFFETYESYFND